MVAPDSVLLPKLFPKNLVSIGQLLRNPLVPNTDTFRGGCARVGENDISTADPEENYEAIVSVDMSGWFDIGLTRLLGAKLRGRRANMLSIRAKSLEYNTLKDSVDVFRRVFSSDEAKRWINDMVLHKAPCYLVIGIQTLCMAEFKRVVLKEGVAGGYVTVPLEATAQIPVHVKGEVSAHHFGSSVGKKVSGVFGIQVQRLNPQIGLPGEIRLKSDVSWKWSYQRIKGTQQEEEKRLGITLEDVAVEDLVELLRLDE
ncbi:hypothetical protein BC939DRAFT_442345 [Gamsiella multidivaricata]|uniref:uncharacterized protein n=1 Tax=Gamsiella multidivaricata TaxID=101098 RepID=UPI00221F8167|nr:uncharacterized protein BC939DRAFT_442345 [Gamsiella multidivaricata]KAI7828944.1 hypothetical protein BC939DRAFT_442345 [Gamsiella multidivaricata]